MKTIPAPLVKFQQAVIVLTLLLALVLQQPWLVAGLFLLMVVSLVGGPKVNPIFAVGRRLLQRRLPGAEQEDAAAQRFNQTIAVTLLGASSLLLLTGKVLAGWIVAAMVAVAAGLALAGFCIGCVLFLQLRLLQARLQANRTA